MVFGLALVLALVFGTLSVAAAHTGFAGLFHLNHNNNATATSILTIRAYPLGAARSQKRR